MVEKTDIKNNLKAGRNSSNPLRRSMKTKIVEAECVVTIQYENNYKVSYNLENIIHRKCFTDFASDGHDAIRVTKLVNYEQRNDYE